MYCNSQRTHVHPALRAAQLIIIGGEQVEAPTVSRRLLPSCYSDGLRSQPLAGGLAGWLNAEHDPRVSMNGENRALPRQVQGVGTQPSTRCCQLTHPGRCAEQLAAPTLQAGGALS